MSRIMKFYKLKFVIVITAVFTLSLTIFGAVLYNVTKSIIQDQLGMNAQGVAVAASLVIMEDIEEYKKFLEIRDVNSEYYAKMQNYFANIKADSNIKFIYTERRLDADTIEFILDSEPAGSPDYSPVGSVGTIDWERKIAYDTMQASYFKLFDHQIWGKLIVAYAPLFGQSGEFLGVLGVNIDGTRLIKDLNYLFIMMASTYILLISGMLVFLMKFSDTILEPMVNDKLTGAISKRYFEKIMNSEMQISLKNNVCLSILMLDLDHFKKINDTYGHEFGDKALRYISKNIKDMLRKTDFFVRYGGDEFIVVLPNTTLEDGAAIAERIRKTVENSSILNEDENVNVKVTVSIGVAEMKKTILNISELINNVDKAMYDAKTVKNKVSLFSRY